MSSMATTDNGDGTSSPDQPQAAPAALAPLSGRRNIVILMDGTSNEYCMANTNIVKLAGVMQVDAEQLMYYDSGVGTTLPSAASTWSDVRRRVGISMDVAFAWNFPEHVQRAYRYLMETYQDGDRVFIFGFSRGSYSARCLAGMIEKVGLLPAGNHSQIPFAYKIYKDKNNVCLPCHDVPSHPSPDSMGGPGKDVLDAARSFLEPLAHGYKRTFGISKDVKVHFLGVYDTVASLGLLEVEELPFASNVDMVGFFRHALALNERRAKFQPVYRQPDAPVLDSNHIYCTEHFFHILGRFFKNMATRIKGLFGRLPVSITPDNEDFDQKMETGDSCGHQGSGDGELRTKEVWFLGCHSDVGGGNFRNGLPSLSNISFRWMVREAEHCGLKLDAPNVLLQSAFDVPPVQALVQTMPQLKPLVMQLREQGILRPTQLKEQSQIRSLIKQLLTPDKIHTLVDQAASFDTEEDWFQPETIRRGDFDLTRLPKESLTFRWWFLEWMILQTRNCGGGAGTTGDRGAYSWRVNNFRYRKMLPGKQQKIHRSVQRKLQYHAYFAGDKSIIPWTEPTNCLPPDWDTTWAELGSGAKQPGGGWED